MLEDDGKGRERQRDAYVVLFSEFLVERSAHYYSADAGGSAEVGFAGFPPRGMEGWRRIE